MDSRPRLRVVRIGGVSKPALLAALRTQGVQLNAAGETLFAMDSFTTADEICDCVTEELSVAELGLPDGALMAAILERAEARGLAVCPLELGPHLRLQWLDQPDGGGTLVSQHRAPPGSLTVMSPPLSLDDAVPKGFYLRRLDGVLWLRGYRCTPDHVWSPEDRLLFVRP